MADPADSICAKHVILLSLFLILQIIPNIVTQQKQHFIKCKESNTLKLSVNTVNPYQFHLTKLLVNMEYLVNIL